MSRVLSAVAILVGFASALAAAQEPAASVSCERKAGRLVIRYTPELNEEKPPWPKNPVPVRFGRLMDLDKKQSTVVGTRSKTVTCQLPLDRFEVKLDPGIPNVNLLGRCGAAYTGVVTVKRNGVAVIKEQEFEDMNCHARERTLSRITFRDGAEAPELEYVKSD